MHRKRLFILILSALLLTLSAGNLSAQRNVDTSDYLGTMRGMLDNFIETAQTYDGSNRGYIDAVANSGDPLYLAPLIDMWYFARSPFSNFYLLTDAIVNGVERLSDQDFGEDWQAYFEWASAENIDLPPGYDVFKGELFGRVIDPRFEELFAAGVQDSANINLLEAVWGGVRVDGIPSLVNARQISPEQAALEGETLRSFCRGDDCRYPATDELVFGVSINGDNRAYPLRLLNWHEMFNDVIGMIPLYDAPDGEAICNFRAPRPFQARGQQEGWIFVTGDSAGCPTTGGFIDPESAVSWANFDSTADALAELPDLSENDMLNLTASLSGSVDGTPVMLAYCTLCGAGILYNPIIPDLTVDGENLGTVTLEFGSTGMLMRSNKLMYDRTTFTVWNALTGTPAFGPLVESDIRLEVLPVVTTDWQTWLEDHPDTSVLSLSTGFERNYGNGAAYSEYFNNEDFIMFPVFQQDTSEQENKEMVFALNIDDTPKAYPLATIIPEVVVNDTLSGTNVVIVARETPERDFFEPGGAAVRAYASEGYTFSAGEDASHSVDADGVIWEVTEEALVSAEGDTLPRIGGHLAFWFGWYSFYPDTLVYEAME